MPPPPVLLSPALAGRWWPDGGVTKTTSQHHQASVPGANVNIQLLLHYVCQRTCFHITKLDLKIFNTSIM